MYVRLAFAVAAHLDPEILIVDEVLAVGDAQFQKKCSGKMGEVAKGGRTVLLVSHNMAAIKTLCESAVLIQQGRVAALGEATRVVQQYLTGGVTDQSVRRWGDPAAAPGNNDVRLLAIEATRPDGDGPIDIDSGVQLSVTFYNHRPRINLDCTLHLLNHEGVVLFESGCLVTSHCDSRRGVYRVTGRIPEHLLNAGAYHVNLLFGKDQYYVLWSYPEALSFTVENTATGRGNNLSRTPGVIRPLIAWTSEFSEEPAPLPCLAGRT
jgi:lipopolysaccharide transport system ATP-binding protein